MPDKHSPLLLINITELRENNLEWGNHYFSILIEYCILVQQREVGWLGFYAVSSGCIAAIIIGRWELQSPVGLLWSGHLIEPPLLSRIADYLTHYMKEMLLILNAGCICFTFWFVMMIQGYLPRSTSELFQLISPVIAELICIVCLCLQPCCMWLACCNACATMEPSPSIMSWPLRAHTQWLKWSPAPWWPSSTTSYLLSFLASFSSPT